MGESQGSLCNFIGYNGLAGSLLSLVPVFSGLSRKTQP